ncbi:MAG: hypothetical protein KDK71_02385 [Chlamydiia bacterium]|nr:hypothetical protein [Chlamydiia bacterium]
MKQIKLALGISLGLLASATANEHTKNENSSYQFPDYKKQDVNTLDYPSYDLPYQESGGYLGVEFLYWQNIESNLAYAIDQPPNTDPNNLVVLQGHIKHVTYRWDPGVRARVGWKFSPDSLDVSMIYTYFHNEGGDAITARPNRTVSGLFPDALGPLVSDASSKADLMYQLFELQGKHPFQVSNSFLMNYIFGVRGAWISQGWSTEYKTNIVIIPPLGRRLETLVQNNWKFSGAGLRAGLSMDWFIGWGIYANVQTSMSGIVGRLRMKQKVDTTSFTGYGYTLPADTRIIPVWELKMGFGWRKAFGNFVASAHVDWEMNLWSRLSQTYYYPLNVVANSKLGSTSVESINLQGISAGVKVEF